MNLNHEIWTYGPTFIQSPIGNSESRTGLTCVGMLKRAIYGAPSIAAKYYDVLGIMVISRSLMTVHHAMYDPFEHTHAFIYIHTIRIGIL